MAPKTAVTAPPVEPVEQRLPVEPVKAEKVVPTDTVMATAEPGAVEQTDELPLPTQKAEMRIDPRATMRLRRTRLPPTRRILLWKSFCR